jgi:membrane protein DedA with SNARE-associated domain
MSDLLQATQPYLEQYGAWAVFAGVMLESFGVPLPGEGLLIAAALLASKGYMHILPILLLAWLGAVAGDNIGYGIGRFAGRFLVLKYGRIVLLTERRLGNVEAFFRKYGAPVVIGARFFEGLRQFNGIVAGVAGMAWVRFLTYNVIGAFLWTCFWGVLFYQLGERAGPFAARLRDGEVLLVLGILVAAAAFAFAVILRRKVSKMKGRDG